MRRLAVLLAMLGLVASACTSEPEEFTGSRLKNPYEAADIALTDTSGAPYSLGADTTKPLTVVFFGYTHCPDFCPMVMNNLAAAMNRLDADDQKAVDVVFVTTDPARDDQQTLRSYLDEYDKRFIGLTGDLDTIIDVGDPLHIYVNDGVKLPSGGYDLGGHSTFTLAIDSSHRAVALWNQETSSTEFAADIHTLLTED
ncbi:SCO family protein [Nocardioides carbamazepini]|uniref:SCO family protein n=1 Tax=Nocardioides carbamazepini TaxID=2854259 RepID=UPI00214A1C0B|nr:SCO family protein [Nocardioides carbamazepini]